MSASLRRSVWIYVCVVFAAARVFVWADEPPIVASCAVIAAFVGGGGGVRSKRADCSPEQQNRCNIMHLI